MAKLKQVYSTWREAPVRQTFQAATSRFVIAPMLIISLIVVCVLFYYYNLYTQIIDARLRGDNFVRSSGIYASPLYLYNGSNMRLNALLMHLRSVGYLERGTTQNDKRGQYAVRGTTVEILPGSDAVIDGDKAFHNLRVVFGRDGNFIQSITDLENRQRMEQAQVEPELISSVINPEREKRKNIEYKDLPQPLIDAIVAIEDRQFFEHPGINWRGTLRALVRDYQTGEFREGGSSITQQLVKNFFLKPERTLKRKLSEAYMSIILEQRLSKEEIMSMYCNQIYLGQRGGFSINGFGQAARAYFGKDVSNLTLAESACLAGIIQRPNYFSPYLSPERTLERRKMVLKAMVESGKIDQATADATNRQPLGLIGKASGVDASDAPYFVDYLMRQIESQYADGQMQRSMRVYSTVDLNLQRLAYQAVAKNMADVDRLLARRKGGTAGLQAALVAMNPKTGEILAMVGGRDYASSQLNRATDAKRQPGSAFKPFVYAAGLELGRDDPSLAITPAAMFVDEPRTFEYDGKVYDPGNFGDKYEMRPMTARDALVSSKNVITVEIAQRIGFAQVQRFAEKAGFTKVPPYPSIALGVGEASPLQVTAAYTAFANQGRRATPIAIKRVTSKDGTTLFESRAETREVMSPQVAYIMTSMMEDVIDRGTGTRVRQMGFQGIAAGKTGTSHDGWFAGYTPNLVCVVWVGFDDNTDIRLTGGATAAPIWADFMIRALQIRPELGGQFEPPASGLVTYDIDPLTGQIASPGAPDVRHEIFLSGTGPDSEVPPDSSAPESDPSIPGVEPDFTRPTPVPRSPNDDRTMTGIDNGTIPLPPEVRRDGSEEPPQSTPRSSNERPSFLKKLAVALGFTSDPSKPGATPTPWTSSGLRPVTRPENGNDAPRTPPPEFRPSSQRAAPISTPRYTPPRPTPAPAAKTPVAKEPVKPDNQKANRTNTATTPKPDPSPKPTAIPTPKPAPPQTVAAPSPSPRGPTGPRARGTFFLEVCAESGLLPVDGVCTTTVRRQFRLGEEPTSYCSPSRHRGRSQ